MRKYIAFLRGINISGKNKIVMSGLKTEFEQLGFSDVSTYLNSGNVLFASESESITEIKRVIKAMINDKFNLDIPVYVVRKENLSDILDNAPSWWGTGNKEKYDNLIFVITEDTTDAICDMLGRPTDGLELVQVYKDVIFWNFDRNAYQKCNWWKKTAGADIAEKLTIRTANTVKKLLEIM